MSSISRCQYGQAFGKNSIVSIILPVPHKRMFCFTSHNWKDRVEDLGTLTIAYQFISSNTDSDILHL